MRMYRSDFLCGVCLSNHNQHSPSSSSSSSTEISSFCLFVITWTDVTEVAFQTELLSVLKFLTLSPNQNKNHHHLPRPSSPRTIVPRSPGFSRDKPSKRPKIEDTLTIKLSTKKLSWKLPYEPVPSLSKRTISSASAPETPKKPLAIIKTKAQKGATCLISLLLI